MEIERGYWREKEGRRETTDLESMPEIVCAERSLDGDGDGEREREEKKGIDRSRGVIARFFAMKL